jgi:hypothetical protein
MRNTKFMTLALAASVALGLLGAKASAAPTNGMAAVSQQVTNEIQKVRWWLTVGVGLIRVCAARN